jgi:hypothetical protein
MLWPRLDVVAGRRSKHALPGRRIRGATLPDSPRGGVMLDPFDRDMWIDHNGCLTERRWLGGQEVIVHYDDIPESDFTVKDGIRCTTPLRTVLDLAGDLEPAELERIVRDCLVRRLFTLDEAYERIKRGDLLQRRGTRVLRELLDRKFAT